MPCEKCGCTFFIRLSGSKECGNCGWSVKTSQRIGTWGDRSMKNKYRYPKKSKDSEL